ncbi:hypothetical protein C8Q76DRAFT_789191 [Earliella scabrosa]|nr:hypothetical protein C8Q76DRAFT_789191 [Earliella scabrosa]
MAASVSDERTDGSSGGHAPREAGAPIAQDVLGHSQAERLARQLSESARACPVPGVQVAVQTVKRILKAVEDIPEHDQSEYIRLADHCVQILSMIGLAVTGLPSNMADLCSEPLALLNSTFEEISKSLTSPAVVQGSEHADASADILSQARVDLILAMQVFTLATNLYAMSDARHMLGSLVASEIGNVAGAAATWHCIRYRKFEPTLCCVPLRFKFALRCILLCFESALLCAQFFIPLFYEALGCVYLRFQTFAFQIPLHDQSTEIVCAGSMQYGCDGSMGAYDNIFIRMCDASM